MIYQPIKIYPHDTLSRNLPWRIARRSETLSKDKAKLLIKQGIDPSEDRKDQKRLAQISLSNSFESVARSRWDSWKFNKSHRHAEYVIRRLEADILPAIGNKPNNEISALAILATIKNIELRGASDIAKRALSTCGRVFRYVVVHGLAECNAAADIKPSDALKPTKKTNYARLPAHELPELMQKIESYDGQFLTRLALKLMALTFVRTGELIGASWDEIDLDQKN